MPRFRQSGRFFTGPGKKCLAPSRASGATQVARRTTVPLLPLSPEGCPKALSKPAEYNRLAQEGVIGIGGVTAPGCPSGRATRRRARSGSPPPHPCPRPRAGGPEPFGNPMAALFNAHDREAVLGPIREATNKDWHWERPLPRRVEAVSGHRCSLRGIGELRFFQGTFSLCYMLVIYGADPGSPLALTPHGRQPDTGCSARCRPC
jgi:hypothetical protein